MAEERKIGVLIVEDSAIVRNLLTEALAGEPDLEVVGSAPDPYVARDKILALRPDVLTLDIEMPRMDGLTFLKKLMHFHAMPVVVISSLTQPSCRSAVKALELGAVEVLAKPGGPYSVGELRNTLASKIRARAGSRVRRPQPTQELPSLHRPSRDTPSRDTTSGDTPSRGTPSRDTLLRDKLPPAALIRLQLPGDTVIAIGASTGGTEAISAVLSRLPASMPGI